MTELQKQTNKQKTAVEKVVWFPGWDSSIHTWKSVLMVQDNKIQYKQKQLSSVNDSFSFVV